MNVEPEPENAICSEYIPYIPSKIKCFFACYIHVVQYNDRKYIILYRR